MIGPDALAFDDVLLRPRLGVLESREDADVSTFIGVLPIGLPFLSAPMTSVTGFDLAKKLAELGGVPVFHRFQTVMEQAEQANEVKLHTHFMAVGLSKDRVDALRGMGFTNFCLDVAHGHSLKVLNFLRDVKPRENETWIAGNVASNDGFRMLAEAGVDAVKVGIGPGSACTTRIVTGFGVPQLTAIMEAAKVAKEYGNHVSVIADGGIRNSGDVVKAIAAGADAVMIGRLFAQAEEAPNFGTHYGAASALMSTFDGSRVPEGTAVSIADSKSLHDIIWELEWGLRSGISYGGARNIQELQEKAEFITLRGGGREESFTRVSSG